MKPILEPWLARRQSGVLAHISSLPSATGIGNLGRSARRFVDFLSQAGFAYWQVCPVGPTGFGDSPYQSFSAFAGNPYFIDIQELLGAGLLIPSEADQLRRLPRDRVDYGGLYGKFWTVLESAHERFATRPAALNGSVSFPEFVEKNASWLDPYTTFMALKRRFAHVSWVEWPLEFRNAAATVTERLSSRDHIEKERHAFYQYMFFRQWDALKSYAAERGVQLIGDMPIYVALDSADVWSNRSIFRIQSDGTLAAVAGVPPDYFSDTGQMWGNPLYDWDELERTGFRWWIERIESSRNLFDVIRLDHFRGFQDFWVVPEQAADASHGHWEQGPGIAFFETIARAIAKPRLIAEDLGYINREVYDLKIKSGMPGMKILQFGFGHDDNHVNLPHFFCPHQVVYSGTHDNDTTQGWINNLEGDDRERVFEYFGLGDDARAGKLVEAAFASVARLAIAPAQDLLDLPSEARMNRPGSATGNWSWRLTDAQLTALHEKEVPRLRRLHERYHRLSDDKTQRDFSAPPAEAAAPVPSLAASLPPPQVNICDATSAAP